MTKLVKSERIPNEGLGLALKQEEERWVNQIEDYLKHSVDNRCDCRLLPEVSHDAGEQIIYLIATKLHNLKINHALAERSLADEICRLKIKNNCLGIDNNCKMRALQDKQLKIGYCYAIILALGAALATLLILWAAGI